MYKIQVEREVGFSNKQIWFAVSACTALQTIDTFTSSSAQIPAKCAHPAWTRTEICLLIVHLDLKVMGNAHRELVGPDFTMIILP